MSSKVFRTFDYGSFIDLFIDGIKKDLGIEMISANDVGDPPRMPYVTFQFLKSRVDVGQPIIGNTPYFDIYVTFTAHDRNTFSALDIAGKVSSWLKDSETIYQLQVNHVAVVNVYDYEQRDSLISMEYDRQAGFDALFRVADPTNDTNAITDVSLKDANGNGFSLPKISSEEGEINS